MYVDIGTVRTRKRVCKYFSWNALASSLFRFLVWDFGGTRWRSWFEALPYMPEGPWTFSLT